VVTHLSIVSTVGVGKTVEAGLLTRDMVRLREEPLLCLSIVDEVHTCRPKRLAELARALLKPSEIADVPSLPRALPFQPRKLRVLSPSERYEKWMRLARAWEEEGLDQRRVEQTTNKRVRNPGIRKAVLLRSGGRCENPQCQNPGPIGWTDSGDPILEIDHVIEHARGGRDYGSNAIALCPNCHAVKTYGRHREEFACYLLGVAAERHQAALPGRSAA
jgi:hypothetical protein